MTDHLDVLDMEIAVAVSDARGDEERMNEIVSALVAGIGLAIVAWAHGEPDAVNALCESAAQQVFEAAAEVRQQMAGDGAAP